MDAFIEFGRGPLFRFAVAVALLGLGRHVVLSILGLVRARRRAGDKSLAWGQAAGRTLSRLNPLRYLAGHRRLYTLLSVVFHAGVVLVPALYLGHVRLWQRGLGFGWPALPATWADTLTLATLAAGVLLVVARAANSASRALSRFQDFAIPIAIVAEFFTGFFLAHPAQNPFALDSLMLVHVYVGDLLLLATPFTKIAHCALLPLSQFVVEMAWRFVPGAGRDVVKTLGKEGQPI